MGWDHGEERKEVGRGGVPPVEKQGGVGPAKVGLQGGVARWGLSDLGLRLFVHYLSENSC